MSVTALFERKIKLEMKLVHVLPHRPRHIVKLEPIEAEDFTVSLEAVNQWSSNNAQLYELILENGMAEHICNQQFLYEFYRELKFDQMKLRGIDDRCLRFRHLRVLSLTQNNIQVLQNIPQSCKQLYLDFNQISRIDTQRDNNLELLSISYNGIDDDALTRIVRISPELRCLNVASNRVQDLRGFVILMAQLAKLKILVAFANPISMLSIYRSYITDHLNLLYIDGEKYVKEEPKKQEPKKEQPKKQQPPKDQKKDKKDNKKGGKAVVEEKPPEEPPQEEPKEEPKKELTNQDFQLVRINVKIGNLQGFQGNAFDASLFPADIDVNLTQTTYWASTTFFDETDNNKDSAIGFENATTEEEQVRLNLDYEIKRQVRVSEESLAKFNKGLKVEVYQREPKMVKDPDTSESKPVVNEGKVETTESVLGAVHIDLRKLHKMQKKHIEAKFRLFESNSAKHPLFANPYADSQQRIDAGKAEFEEELKKLEEARAKEAAEEELAKQQKKGGKDQKKAADKKGGKKDAKDAGVSEKRKSQKCSFPVDSREYCVLLGNKMFKGKQLLCVSVEIE